MKHTEIKLKHAMFAVAIGGAIFALPAASRAQASYTNTSTAAAFMATGSAENPDGSDLMDENYGNAGTLAIAPASSTKGAFDSLLLFNTTAAVSQFNAEYGVGNWTITGVQLQLASNFGVQGTQPSNQIFNTINAGSFGIDWLADTTWTVGGGGGSGTPGAPANTDVDYSYIPTLLSAGYDPLGDFTYTPPGNNVYVTYSMPTDAGLDTAAADGAISFLFYAPTNSSVGYLFNSQAFSSNHPELILDASAVPEPGTLAILTAAAGGFWVVRRQKRKS